MLFLPNVGYPIVYLDKEYIFQIKLGSKSPFYPLIGLGIHQGPVMSRLATTPGFWLDSPPVRDL